MNSSEIRQSFIDYFKATDHSHQPSAPVIPLDDPTLLFVNAGMNQFKDVFTGQRKVSYKRAVTSQKCIRAGGKHNDLENVGRTGRHHTFFEMLGNFSFGDYFKEEAIKFAWDWVTKTLQLPKDKLYATVYNDDDDAFKLWEKIAPELKNGRVLRFGKKDNFWSMGDVGPCGPCSEIHVDRGAHLSKNDPSAWINTENERFVEIWNLVFMQYDQPAGGGEWTSLPKPSVDTGAGLERIAAVLQGADSNYETDLFIPLTSYVADITGVKYDPGIKGVSHRVIADHVRSLSFALADGGGLSNEGRGYVLRRILRRAARHGRLLGYKDPLICQLVPTLIDVMGGYFTELKDKKPQIEAVIKSEEERFGELLDTGLALFSEVEKKVKASGSKTISGEDIFKLYDTYGFPVDMTAIMAEEAGLKMDMDGFDKAMKGQKEKSRAGSKFSYTVSIPVSFTTQEKSSDVKPTKFVRGNDSYVFELNAAILNIEELNDNSGRIAVILDQTPFYVESGGQIGDMGTISNDKAIMLVERIVNHQDVYIHVGKLQSGLISDFKIGTKVKAVIDKHRRRAIMRNHTATHLLHASLRKILGDHVKQAGSEVSPERLRFDFAHYQALTSEEIASIERIVNEQILRNCPVNTEIMPVEKAMKSGAMALFDEKYGDEVRVVSVSGFSKELCGGTHVRSTAEIGSFIITDESAIASGVRRIEAVTGRKATELSRANKKAVDKIKSLLNVPVEEVVDAVTRLHNQVGELQKEIKKVKSEMFTGGNSSVGKMEKIGDIEFHYHDFGETDPDTMSGWTDAQKGSHKAIIGLALGFLNGKSTFMAAGSQAVIDKKIHIGNIFGELARNLGGKGGGKVNFARGGLPPDLKHENFIAEAKKKLESI